MDPAMCWLAGRPPQPQLISSTLDPHVGLATVPGGERADAVARAEYIIQPILQYLKRNAEVNLLRHLVRWLDVQGQLGHDAKSSKRHNRARKLVSIDIPPYLNQVAVGNDELYCCDGGGQNALVIAGPVGTG